MINGGDKYELQLAFQTKLPRDYDFFHCVWVLYVIATIKTEVKTNDSLSLIARKLPHSILYLAHNVDSNLFRNMKFLIQ